MQWNLSPHYHYASLSPPLSVSPLPGLMSTPSTPGLVFPASSAPPAAGVAYSEPISRVYVNTNSFSAGPSHPGSSTDIARQQQVHHHHHHHQPHPAATATQSFHRHSALSPMELHVTRVPRQTARPLPTHATTTTSLPQAHVTYHAYPQSDYYPLPTDQRHEIASMQLELKYHQLLLQEQALEMRRREQSEIERKLQERQRLLEAEAERIRLCREVALMPPSPASRDGASAAPQPSQPILFTGSQSHPTVPSTAYCHNPIPVETSTSVHRSDPPSSATVMESGVKPFLTNHELATTRAPSAASSPICRLSNETTRTPTTIVSENRETPFSPPSSAAASSWSSSNTPVTPLHAKHAPTGPNIHSEPIEAMASPPVLTGIRLLSMHSQVLPSPSRRSLHQVRHQRSIKPPSRHPPRRPVGCNDEPAEVIAEKFVATTWMPEDEPLKAELRPRPRLPKREARRQHRDSKLHQKQDDVAAQTLMELSAHSAKSSSDKPENSSKDEWGWVTASVMDAPESPRLGPSRQTEELQCLPQTEVLTTPVLKPNLSVDVSAAVDDAHPDAITMPTPLSAFSKLSLSSPNPLRPMIPPRDPSPFSLKQHFRRPSVASEPSVNSGAPHKSRALTETKRSDVHKPGNHSDESEDDRVDAEDAVESFKPPSANRRAGVPSTPSSVGAHETTSLPPSASRRIKRTVSERRGSGGSSSEENSPVATSPKPDAALNGIQESSDEHQHQEVEEEVEEEQGGLLVTDRSVSATATPSRRSESAKPALRRSSKHRRPVKKQARQRERTSVSSERQFRCRHCSKSFRQMSNLTCHERTHTGEKPYKCDECSVAFAQSSNLARHKRSHTGVHPFSCRYCNKSTARKSTMKTHVLKFHMDEPGMRGQQPDEAIVVHRAEEAPARGRRRQGSSRPDPNPDREENGDDDDSDESYRPD